MKNHTKRISQSHHERGASLLTVLMVAVCSAMMVGAALTLSMVSSRLGKDQADSQAAVLLADAGINSELQFIALNSGSATPDGLSSQPGIYPGVLATPPGQNSPVPGRPGTVSGYSGGSYFVSTSNDAASTAAWDGSTSPYFITSWAQVGKSWRRVQVRCETPSTSLFNQYGLFALACFPGNSNASILVNSGTVANVSGMVATNGQISVGNNASLTVSNAINADTADSHNSGAQFTSGNLAPNGALASQSLPILAPTTATIIRNAFSLNSATSDNDAWAYVAAHNNNSTGVYQFKTTALTSVISLANCMRYPMSGSTLSAQLWQSANAQPGTTGKYKTLIFEPGDYYFSAIQLAYDPGIGMVIDPCAYARGGRAGQVRFWCYSASKWAAYSFGIPITNTIAAGSNTPDPGLFRLYFSIDSGAFSLQRTQGAKNWQGQTLIGDWNYYCGIYACTRGPGQSNNSNKGSQIALVGTSNGQGAAVIQGSIIADQISFNGANVAFVQSQTTTSDPTAPGQAAIVQWSLLQ